MNKLAKIAIMIPTINRAEDLLVESLDTLSKQLDQVEKILIIDNGKQNIRIDHPKFATIVADRNLGVAASWNLGMDWLFTNHPEISHVIALNDDIALGETQLVEIRQVLTANPDKWFMVGNYYWAVWAITRDGMEAMTYATNPRRVFDVNYYPAWGEDNDFHWRLRQIDESKYLGGVSLMTPEKCRNSQSLAKDPTLNSTFERNKQYHIMKWGGGFGREVYKVPFNGAKVMGFNGDDGENQSPQNA